MSNNGPAGFFSNPCCGATSEGACPYGWVSVLATVTQPPTDPVPYRYYRIATNPVVDTIFEEHDNEYAYWSPANGWVICPPTEGDKLSEEGSCTIECWDGTEWTDAPSSAIVLTGQNIGGAAGQFFSSWVGNDLRLRTLEGTGAAVVSTNGNVVRVHVPVPPAATGEVNSGANVGAGYEWWKDKVGLNLRFRTAVSSNGSILLTQNADTVDLRMNSAMIPVQLAYTMANVGAAGGEVYSTLNGLSFEMRRLRGVTNVGVPFTVANNGSNIDISFLPNTVNMNVWLDTLQLYAVAPSQYSVMSYDTTNKWVHALPGNLGAGNGIWVAPMGFKSFIAGSGVTITPSGTTLTFAATGGTYTGSNLGSAPGDGVAVLSGLVANDFQFRRALGGVGITATQSTNSITYDWTGTASNVGAGDGWWKDKSVATLRFKSHIAGNGLTNVVGADDITTNIDFWSTLVQNHGSATGALFLNSVSAPWTLKGLLSGTGILVTSGANDNTVSHAMTVSNLGTGVGVLDGISAADIQGRSILAGAGIGVTLVGDDVVIENTSGGSSGSGASGTALVGGYHNSGTTTAMLTWGGRVNVKFPSTNLSVTTFTKNGANEEFTCNKAGKFKVSAKYTALPGAGHHEYMIMAQHFTGGVWVDIAASEAYAYTPNTGNDRQTVHTGEFVVTMAVGEKLKVQGDTTIGGTLTPYFGPYGTAITIEEAVGPIWEVLTDATTALTLNSGHNGKIIYFTNGGAITVTLDEDLLVSFQCDIIQSGTGLVSMVAGGAATVQSVVGTTPDISAQHGRARIVALAGTGANDAVFNVSGDIV